MTEPATGSSGIIGRIGTAVGNGVAFIVKLLMYSIGGIVALGILIFVPASISDKNLQETFAGCAARQMEHRIPEDKLMEFSDVCMKSHGYRKRDFCAISSFPSSYCYRPSWLFWVS